MSETESGADAAPEGADERALSPAEGRKRMASAKSLAAAFGEIVGLLVRAKSEQAYRIKDLEWLVLPAVAAGQFVVANAQSKRSGAVAAVGAVLWAEVSSEVDRRLSASGDRPLRLAPEEWRSGRIPWIVLTCGDAKVVSGILRQLGRTVFKGRQARVRVKGADGRAIVASLGAARPAAAS